MREEFEKQKKETEDTINWSVGSLVVIVFLLVKIDDNTETIQLPDMKTILY